MVHLTVRQASYCHSAVGIMQKYIMLQLFQERFFEVNVLTFRISKNHKQTFVSLRQLMFNVCLDFSLVYAK